MSIAVAVSGGADSLLSLLLLKEQGLDPIALHGSFLPPGPGAGPLQENLTSLCKELDIPLHICRLHDEFHQLVIAPFIRSYCSGRTPNPCAWCNRSVKFGLLLNQARALGADRLATGHYVRKAEAGPRLYRGLDPFKDQSYFLALITREQVSRACFPLGVWRKDNVPEALRDRGCTAPIKQESQEVCFIPDNDYRAFLEASGQDLPQPGPIMDSSGAVLGRHHGLHRYTVGQRRGLGIAASRPLYVLRKNLRRNALVVGPRNELQALSCHVRELNCLLEPAHWPRQVLVQTLYRQDPKPASVAFETSQLLKIDFQEPITPATPGQVAAFYLPTGRLIGGGIIHQECA